MKPQLQQISILFLLIILVILGCRKDKFIEDPSANIRLEIDSILFDTVFATVGSTTRQFKIYNQKKKAIKIDVLRLKGGTNSQFRINADGIAGVEINDLEIAAGDSIFVFAEVTVDPNNQTAPFVVEDEIEIIVNTNISKVKLVAWGRNAHYYTPKVFTQGLPPYSCLDGDCDTSVPPVNQTWINDLPYVIYGYLVIDENDQLTIDKGCEIYFHANSGIWVYQGGSITVNGTLQEPVVFQGDRLEASYQDKTGQWDRIWINEGSNDNVFNYAIIKNSFIGIQAETLPFSPNTVISGNNLVLNNCIIDNTAAFGILAKNYQIQANNCLITKCGQYAFAVTGGGQYDFTHVTIANYWTESTRETESVYLQNYYTDINGNTQVRNIDWCNFTNCIVYGNIDNEFNYDELSPGTINFTYTNSILKTNKSTSGSNYVSVLKNTNPLFTDENNGDFHLQSSSQAVDFGISSPITTDLDGNTRDANPDLGCYEYVP